MADVDLVTGFSLRRDKRRTLEAIKAGLRSFDLVLWQNGNVYYGAVLAPAKVRTILGDHVSSIIDGLTIQGMLTKESQMVKESKETPEDLYEDEVIPWTKDLIARWDLEATGGVEDEVTEKPAEKKALARRGRDVAQALKETQKGSGKPSGGPWRLAEGIDDAEAQRRLWGDGNAMGMSL